jgi:hypothetical protein
MDVSQQQDFHGNKSGPKVHLILEIVRRGFKHPAWREAVVLDQSGVVRL